MDDGARGETHKSRGLVCSTLGPHTHTHTVSFLSMKKALFTSGPFLGCPAAVLKLSSRGSAQAAEEG